MMRRLNLVLLATWQLCHARQHSFSVQDDLLAYPQFEIVFSGEYITEADAIALLESNGSPTYTATFASQTDPTANVRESTTADGSAGQARPAAEEDSHDGEKISESYEMINPGPGIVKYLCSIPVIAPPPALNQTATELAKAEEARELSRASAKGWELMNGMEGTCLYYISGWWSYSFCYGKDIVQFHAVPNGQKGGPPVKDPMSAEYVLGRTHPLPPTSGSNRRHAKQPIRNEEEENEVATADGEGSRPAAPKMELQVKGDQRYLVQRLEGGTVCDLTGRDRTIEVQYHCAPNTLQDRISWIKEVTTCTYLMVVSTPRLCSEVAFQPPEQQRAHAVSCRFILADEAEGELYKQQMRIDEAEMKVILAEEEAIRKEEEQNNPHQHANPHTGKLVGGVVIGGRKLLGTTEDGQPAASLPPPRHFAAGKGMMNPLIEILAHSRSRDEGGDVNLMSNEELEQLNLDPEAIEKLRDELQRMAGDKAWKLEIVKVAGGVPEIRGIIDSDDDEAAEGAGQQAEDVQGGGKKTGQGQGRKDSKKGKGKASDRRPEDDEGGDPDEAGSEEKFFKEEL